MSTTAFPSYANNAKGALASAYLAGSGSLVLGTGQGAAFGSSFPIRLCVVTAASYGTAAEALAILQATGRSGDTLTGVSAVEGSADQPFGVGDVVEMRWTAGDANLVSSAVNALETTVATLSPPAGSGGALQASRGGILTAAASFTIATDNTLVGVGMADPASPADLAFWPNLAQGAWKVRTGGLNARLGGPFADALSAGPVASNTAAWTSLLSSPIALPAGKMLAGKVLHWELWGSIGTTSAAQTLTLRILVGGVVVLTGQATNVPASMAGQVWVMDRGYLQVLAGGVTGLASGFFGWQAWSAANSGVNILGTQAGGGGMGAPSTIDWTQAQTLDLQAQWTTVSAANAIQLKGGFFRIDG